MEKLQNAHADEHLLKERSLSWCIWMAARKQETRKRE